MFKIPDISLMSFQDVFQNSKMVIHIINSRMNLMNLFFYFRDISYILANNLELFSQYFVNLYF